MSLSNIPKCRVLRPTLSNPLYVKLALFTLAICITGQWPVSVRCVQQSSMGSQPFGQPKAGDKYQLIFADSDEGALKIKFKMIDAMVRSQRETFISNMNRLGSLGYRMLSSLPDFTMAIVALDEGRYEYD